MARGVKSQGQDNRPIARDAVRDLEEVASYYASFSMDTTFASFMARSDQLRTHADKAGKGKKGACDCNLKFDHASCEEGPWIIEFVGISNEPQCNRMRNPLKGTPWILYFESCSVEGSEEAPPPFEVYAGKPYKTAEECINDWKDTSAGRGVKVGKDQCSESPLTPSPTPPFGKAKKQDWCKLDISNCTTVCGRDESAYYVSSEDSYFDFNFDQVVLGFSNLTGECVRYRPHRVKAISYSECIDHGFQRMPYKKYKNLDACCRDNGGCGKVNSTVWKDDQCLLPIGERKDQYVVSANDMRCSTFFTCEQCMLAME